MAEKNKEVKEAVETKQLELCAIPKDFIREKIETLIKENEQVFKEYFLLVEVYNTQVNIPSIVQENSTEE